MPKPAAKSATPVEMKVTDADAAALLVDSRRNRFLHPFIGRACGVAEAAREAGVTRSLMSYWVARLAEAGLLRPEGEGARHRAWRATADCFVVALDDMPRSSDRALLDAQMDPFIDRAKEALSRTARREASAWDFTIRRTAVGVYQTIAPRAGKPSDAHLSNNRGVFALGADEFAALRDELEAIFQRYGRLHRPGLGRTRVLYWSLAVEDLE